MNRVREDELVKRRDMIERLYRGISEGRERRNREGGGKERDRGRARGLKGKIFLYINSRVQNHRLPVRVKPRKKRAPYSTLFFSLLIHWSTCFNSK